MAKTEISKSTKDTFKIMSSDMELGSPSMTVSIDYHDDPDNKAYFTKIENHITGECLNIEIHDLENILIILNNIDNKSKNLGLLTKD